MWYAGGVTINAGGSTLELSAIGSIGATILLTNPLGTLLINHGGLTLSSSITAVTNSYINYLYGSFTGTATANPGQTLTIAATATGAILTGNIRQSDPTASLVLNPGSGTISSAITVAGGPSAISIAATFNGAVSGWTVPGTVTIPSSCTLTGCQISSNAQLITVNVSSGAVTTGGLFQQIQAGGSFYFIGSGTVGSSVILGLSNPPISMTIDGPTLSGTVSSSTANVVGIYLRSGQRAGPVTLSGSNGRMVIEVASGQTWAGALTATGIGARFNLSSSGGGGARFTGSVGLSGRNSGLDITSGIFTGTIGSISLPIAQV